MEPTGDSDRQSQDPILGALELQEQLETLAGAGRGAEALEIVRELVSRAGDSPDDEIQAIYGLRMLPMLQASAPDLAQEVLDLLERALADVSRPNLVATAISCFAGLDVSVTGYVRPRGENRTECFIIAAIPAGEGSANPEATLRIDPIRLPEGVLDRSLRHVLSQPFVPGEFAPFEAAMQFAAGAGQQELLRGAAERIVQTPDERIALTARLLSDSLDRAIDEGRLERTSLGWYLDVVAKESRSEVRVELLHILPLGLDAGEETNLAIREIDDPRGSSGEGFRILFSQAASGRADVASYLDGRLQQATPAEWIAIVDGAHEAGARDYFDRIRMGVQATSPGPLRDLAETTLESWRVAIEGG